MSNFFSKLFGNIQFSWLPILVTYFAFGASAVTNIATIFFQKEVLALTPSEVAGIGFWLMLPWSMKMVVGVASDRVAIHGSRRGAYLLLGSLLTLAGYAMLSILVTTKGQYLLAMLLVTVGFMVQDVIADALSVEIAHDEEELAQIQTFGRMALLAGGIIVTYLGGILAQELSPHLVFGVAIVFPLLVILTLPILAKTPKKLSIIIEENSSALGHGYSWIVLGVGIGYTTFGVILNLVEFFYSQEIVLIVSVIFISYLIKRMGFTKDVIIAAAVLFMFRAVPGVGQGYSYWAIDQLGFDQKFFGLLGQVSAIIGLIGLLLFRKMIVTRPVSFTLFWVLIASTILSLPNIGLFYGIHEWLGMSARTFAFIDTTISAPLSQLTMVPMLILIAKSTQNGAEATIFAIMASWMNLALSASELFTQYLNNFFAITQTNYANLGLLMIVVTVIGMLPLLTIPMLRRTEIHYEKNK